MKPILITREIAAPPVRVFRAVADVSEFAKAQPQIVSIEFLSDRRSGVGTRFRETRVMGGRQASTELEVTEWVQDRRVGIVADSHGCVWDTVFEVESAGGATRLVMRMEARPHKLIARIMTPLLMPMVRKAVEADMDRVKAYCESPAG